VGQWGIQPLDFWAMSVQDWWWLHDAKKPPKMYGSITESDVDRLIKRQRARKAEEKNGKST